VRRSVTTHRRYYARATILLLAVQCVATSVAHAEKALDDLDGDLTPVGAERAGHHHVADQQVELAGARLRERVLLVEERPGLDLLVGLPHARQAGLHQLLRADRPVADGARRVRRGKPVQLRGVHGQEL